MSSSTDGEADDRDAGPPEWTARDQKVFAGLEERRMAAALAGEDTLEIAPEDLGWALDWVRRAADEFEPGPEGGE